MASAAPASARSLSKDGRVVSAAWAQRDVVSSLKREWRINYITQGSARNYIALPSSSTGREYHSPSGRKLVTFIERNEDKSVNNIYVEVWTLDLASDDSEENNGAFLDATWKIDANLHGSVYSDEWFGGVAWSPDETMFIYVADRIQADCNEKTDMNFSSFDLNSSEHSDKGPIVDSWNTWIRPLRDKYSHTAAGTLGEGYTKHSSPALFLADISKRSSCAMCSDVDKDLVPECLDYYGDPQWSNDGKWIAVTRRPIALREPSTDDDCIADSPYILGVRYCYNRYSSIEMFCAPKSFEDGPKCLSSLVTVSNHRDVSDFCCYSPRFSPDSEFLVYISAPRKEQGRASSVVLPHGTSKILRGVVLEKSDSEPGGSLPVTLVDVVRRASPDSFPGLHLHALPSRPWMGRSSSDIVCSSVWESDSRILKISLRKSSVNGELVLEPLKSNDIEDVSPAPDRNGRMSYTVHDVCFAGAVVEVSSPISPPRLALLQLDRDDAELSYISSVHPRSAMLNGIALPFESTDLVLTCRSQGSDDGSCAARAFDHGVDDISARFQATLLVPSSAKQMGEAVPLIVYPHGGPHSSSVNCYSQGTAALLLMGNAVLYVNYRGSIGFPQECIEALPGLAGSQDVAEVIQATRWALKHSSLLDQGRVGYVGGSHGGFLGAHVSAVKHTPFKRFALRNPVCDIASMVHVSDIPEWAFCEAQVNPISSKTQLALNADPAGLTRMWEISPVARIRKGGVAPGPTLLFVGGCDRRVPPEQSIEWQRVVTEAYGPGIVNLRWYKESGHAIDEVPCGDDVWVHTLEFMQKL